jgi:hypothetical protein
MSHFEIGYSDARASRLYGDSLPLPAQRDDLMRATYCAGYAGARGDLPKALCTRKGRTYWLVRLEGRKPVYNVTYGDPPKGEGGYHDLSALARLKGDVI